MSTVKTNNVQIGQSATATNNFTWYQPASPDGTVRLGNGNAGSVTDAVTVTSAGNVGIGTSSPGAKLDVNGYVRVSAAAGFAYTFDAFSNGQTNNQVSLGQGQGSATDNVGFLYNRANAAFVFGTNNLERMRIDSAGNVGIGTSTPSDPGGTLNFTLANGTAGGTVISKVTASGSGNAVARFDQGVATANAYTIMALYNATGAPYWQFSAGSGVGNVYWTNGTGGVYLAKNGTSWTANSDERIKDIIEPISDAIAKLSTLRTVFGKYKEDAEGTRRLFLIAQDVERVYPEAVSVSTPTEQQPLEVKGVAYTDMIPVLVAAVNELAAQNKDLRARLTVLEGK